MSKDRHVTFAPSNRDTPTKNCRGDSSFQESPQRPILPFQRGVPPNAPFRSPPTSRDSPGIFDETFCEDPDEPMVVRQKENTLASPRGRRPIKVSPEPEGKTVFLLPRGPGDSPREKAPSFQRIETLKNQLLEANTKLEQLQLQIQQSKRNEEKMRGKYKNLKERLKKLVVEESSVCE